MAHPSWSPNPNPKVIRIAQISIAISKARPELQPQRFLSAKRTWKFFKRPDPSQTQIIIVNPDTSTRLNSHSQLRCWETRLISDALSAAAAIVGPRQFSQMRTTIDEEAVEAFLLPLCLALCTTGGQHAMIDTWRGCLVASLLLWGYAVQENT